MFGISVTNHIPWQKGMSSILPPWQAAIRNSHPFKTQFVYPLPKEKCLWPSFKELRKAQVWFFYNWEIQRNLSLCCLPPEWTLQILKCHPIQSGDTFSFCCASVQKMGIGLLSTNLAQRLETSSEEHFNFFL